MNDSKMFIVDSEVLPNVFEKVIAAKRLLRNGDVVTIQDACEKVSLSRSAFYKYKDYVFDFTSQQRGKTVILFLMLKHIPGVLSDIINSIAAVKGNIITINQNIPIMDTAALTLTIDTNIMDISPDELVERLMQCKGCKRIEIVGME
ncbi:MAG: ACT domain-containing protein [Bacillota bacterium]